MELSVYYFTTTSFPDSGMATLNRIKHLSMAMVLTGAHVTVLTPFSDSGRKDSMFMGGVLFRSLCTPAKGLLRKIKYVVIYPFRFFRHLVRDKRSGRVIYVYEANVWLIASAIVIAKLLHCPLCFEGCEYPASLISRNKANWLIKLLDTKIYPKFYDGVVCISQVLVNYYELACRRNTPLLFVPMTIDCNLYEQDYPSPFSFPYIAYTGSMNRKGGGVDLLVDVFGRIATRYPNMHLVLIGKGDDLLRNQLLCRVPQEIRSKIHCLFSGKIPAEKLPAYVKNAKVLSTLPLATKQQEACFPTKLGEYLASGVPTIISRVGNPANILTDEENIFFAPANNSALIAEVFKKVLDDYANAKRVSYRAKRFAKEHFHYTKHSKSISDWLAKIVVKKMNGNDRND